MTGTGWYKHLHHRSIKEYFRREMRSWVELWPGIWKQAVVIQAHVDPAPTPCPPAQVGDVWETQLIFPWSIFYSISYSFPVYDFELGDDDRPAQLFMFLIIFSVLQLNFLKLKL